MKTPKLTSLLPQWAPLAEGYLARPLGASGDTARSVSSSRFDYGVSAADREIIARAESLAKKHNVAMSHVALAWLRKRVTSAIVGINSVSRMDEIIASRDFQLTAEEDASLSETYVPKAVQGHS
jgi:aryl-alcohol dehydrogenase-like predicted oxidoreductase